MPSANTIPVHNFSRNSDYFWPGRHACATVSIFVCLDGFSFVYFVYSLVGNTLPHKRFCFVGGWFGWIGFVSAYFVCFKPSSTFCCEVAAAAAAAVSVNFFVAFLLQFAVNTNQERMRAKRWLSCCFETTARDV